MAAATEFLYTGADPVQTGVVADTIKAARVAVLRGRVLVADGRALPSVTVTVKDRPELGRTVTRADGRYDLAVNAGTPLTLRFERPGFLPVDRRLDPAVRDYETVEDVVLMSFDPNVTTIDTAASTTQVVRGSTMTDSSGSRRATLLFAPDTRATLHLRDGSTRSPTTYKVRASEYTVGARGPQAMPGDLPPSSGYTYAAEYSVDEAINADATAVTFDKPVVSYTDNFLGFPVGSAVPLGSYDRGKAAWIPERNGTVIKILGTDADGAQLDVDGDAVADTGAKLDALGITAAERVTLAGLYTVGAELWRVQVSHFTPWDCNWPFGPPPDADKPNNKPPKTNDPKDPKDPSEPCKNKTGSEIDCEDRALHEDVAVSGTPYQLHYSSARADARGSRSIDIQITGDTIPAPLDHVELTIDIAGRRFAPQAFGTAPNQVYTFNWDGKDGYGRFVNHRQQAVAEVSYVYPAVYRSPAQNDAAFARFGGAVTGDRARKQIRISQTYRFELGRATVPPASLGGWTLSVHHAYDPIAQSVQLGDGDRRIAPVEEVSDLIVNQFSQAIDAPPLYGVAPQPDGSLWFADQQHHPDGSRGPVRIRRRADDGTITDIATVPAPAAQAFGTVTSFALETAPGGGAYGVAAWDERANGPLFHIARDGTVTQVTAGDPLVAQNPTPDGGDGLPASQVLLENPYDLAVGADGSVYVAENSPSGGRVVKIGTDEIVTTVIKPTSGFDRLDNIYGISAGPEGSLYVSTYADNHYRIERLSSSGELRSVVGGGFEPCCSSGQSATQVELAGGGPVAVTRDGSPLFFDGRHLDLLTPDGLIRPLAGTDDYADGEGSRVPALSVGLRGVGISSISEAPDGTVYITGGGEFVGYEIRSVHPGLPGFAVSGYPVPSADGSEIYLFDISGRHTKTVDSLTGATLLAFAYDSSGRLAGVTDRDGRVTTIERSADGTPTAIIAPTGERTTLALDIAGNLAAVNGPGGLRTTLGYTAGGLLTDETDTGGGVHNFTYDGQARLTRDTNPDGVSTDVSGTSVADGQQSTLTTPLGHTLTYVNGRQANGTWRRSRTDAAGASTVSTIAPDGTRGAVLADGRTTSVTPGSDPRFGVLAPFDKAVSVREPSSLTLTASSTRAVTLTDPSDPFSVATWTQTSTVGGATATRTFDGAARTLTLVSAGGLRSVRTIDVKSRTTRLVGDPALDAVTFSYDSAGRLTAGGQGVEHAAYAYDSRDRLVSVTDAAGRTTSYTYDAAGRVATATLAGGEVYAYEHDGLGHLTQVTLPGGGVQKIRWTPFGQSAGFVPAGGGPGYVIARDADGRRASTTLPSGRVESLARDAGGRVTSIAYPGASVDIAYAGATMRPASLTRTPDGGPSSSLALGYDGDLLTSLSSSGASSGSYALTYDERFELTRSVLTSGLSSVTTNITRDADGLVTAQGPFTLARGGPRGATTAISGGPLSVTQAWDGSGRVAERRDSVNGVDAYRMALTRGQSGNITSKVETVGAVAHTFDYAYDPNGRLTQVKRDESVVERYAYDADGNRTNRQIGADPPRIATFDVADRLTADGATAYVFDADGQLVSRGASDTFSYSARGELMAATVGGQAVSYAYDGFGRLVARTAAAGTWRYLYGNPDQQLQVTAAIEPDGTLDTLDYTDAGTVFSILRGATRLYVSTDQSGSARVFSDAAGAVVKAVQYSAYGEILSDSAPALQLPVGYAGGIPDSVTGLVHMGLRDYEPATGRFSTRDPLLLGGGDTNLYAYAGGDPIQHSDPLGLASAGGTVCEGVCVGMKWALTKDGFSACVEAGVGIGEDIEINPDGGLDTDKVYLKASGQLNAGPLANAELSDELSSDGNCVNGKLGSKACVVGYCVTESGDTSANPLGARDALKKKEIGFEAKVVVGVCQALRF